MVGAKPLGKEWREQDGEFIRERDKEMKMVVRQEKRNKNTPGTAGGPGGPDRTLAVKSRKNGRKICFFFIKKYNSPLKNTIFFAYIF